MFSHVTIDARAQSHFPFLFGRGGFAIVNQPSHLPVNLAAG